MEEELNENELEERFYSMLHYVDDSKANDTSNQDALDIIQNAPQSTVRRYWRTSVDPPAPAPANTPYQKINTPNNILPKVTTPKEVAKLSVNTNKPKEEKQLSPVESAPKHHALFQTPVPQDIKKTIEIIEQEENVVELESSDEDEVIEVALPPKPTITIESSDDEVSIQDTPTKAITAAQEKGLNSREVSASPVPSIVSSVSDEFIRGDCIAFNISSRRPDNHSFDFSLHGTDILDSTPAKKKKKKKNKENTSSTPINVDKTPNKTQVIDECFATPKSKAKNKKSKAKVYKVSEKSVPNPDVYDSDSNQSIIEINKQQNSYIVTEKSLPSADVYETDSNPSEPPRYDNRNKLPHNVYIDSSMDKTDMATENNNRKDASQSMNNITIDLTGNTVKDDDIQENIVIGNVTGFAEDDDEYNDSINTNQSNQPKFGSTKVPAILYENLDFDNLKGKEKVCKNRRYSLTTLRAEMEKFYNESWGGEDFNHREIQKNMSRDKSLWVIDPKDRMPSMHRKKYTVICNYCNRAGHRDDTCRQRPPVCFMCGTAGHMEPRCPAKICVNCGSPNHVYSSMCGVCASWGALACAECGARGHPASHCPDLWRRYHNTIEITSKLEENRFTKRHYQMYCSGCTRRGHLVHTCRLSLPFSGLPINSPYVHLYNPLYTPPPKPLLPNLNQQNNYQNRSFQQDCTISSATTPVRTERKRQSKSPTVHETHAPKKRNTSVTENFDRTSKSPAKEIRVDTQRKLSQSKETAAVESETKKDEEKSSDIAPAETTEKAPDFIPIFSSNHDKKGQVIQDNEVSDTSDIVTSARIYVTPEIIEKLKSEEGQNWIKETTENLNVSIDAADNNLFLNIKGKVGDQELFQTALRDWAKDKPPTEQSKPDDENETPSPEDNCKGNDLLVPKNRNNLIRKLNKALNLLKEELGDPNVFYKELNFLQNRHKQLIKQHVVHSKQLDNNRSKINDMQKKLNMILLGQAGLDDGSQHVKELYAIQEKLINLRQKKVSMQLRTEIGKHFHTIFSGLPRNDYGELLNNYNNRHQQTSYKKKQKCFMINSIPKKFNNSSPGQNQQWNRSFSREMKSIEKTMNETGDGNQIPNVRKPLVEKTKNKLVFYHRRLMQARPQDSALKKTKVDLVRKLHSYIASLSRNANASSKNLKKMRKVQAQAQLFLNTV